MRRVRWRRQNVRGGWESELASRRTRPLIDREKSGETPAKARSVTELIRVARAEKNAALCSRQEMQETS